VPGVVPASQIGKSVVRDRPRPAYTGSTWPEDTAPQGCDRSAEPDAGMAGRTRRLAMAILTRKR